MEKFLELYWQDIVDFVNKIYKAIKEYIIGLEKDAE